MKYVGTAIAYLKKDLVWLEILLLAIVLVGRFNVLRGIRALVARRAGEFAARPVTPYLVLMAAAVLPRLLLLPWLPPAEPAVHDEFSHRFLADTLLMGRLANPVHPLWEHFETIHIFHQPTYSSMYVPGQALFLAAGKWLTGYHWAGVLAGAMFASASLLWMLRALFPPTWALLGASFYVCRIAMFSTWTEGYWGGHVAAAAGALLIGSLVRIRRRPNMRDALILGSALILLAWTRPFEGFLMAGAACLFLVWSFINSISKTAWLKQVVIPAGLLLIAGALMTGFFCHRVTGSFLKLPYTVNREVYGWPLTLPWLKPRPIQHRHREHALYYKWELSEHKNISDPVKFIRANILKTYTLFVFYVGPLLAWPLFVRKWTLFELAERRLVLTAGGAVTAGALIEQTTFAHYVAPAAGVVYALLTAAWKSIPDRQRLFATATLFSFVLLVVFVCRAEQVPLTSGWKGNSWCDPPRDGTGRTRIERFIEAHPGRHVAIVRYNARDSHRTWTYNSPDIDSQRVIWAQDMGERNRELLEYYPDRTFWIVEPNAKPPRATMWKKAQ